MNVSLLQLLVYAFDTIALSGVKVSGPFVETSCVFQCIKKITNAEMWA